MAHATTARRCAAFKRLHTHRHALLARCTLRAMPMVHLPGSGFSSSTLQCSHNMQTWQAGTARLCGVAHTRVPLPLALPDITHARVISRGARVDKHVSCVAQQRHAQLLQQIL